MIPNTPFYSRSISVICITGTKAGGPDKQNIKILNLIYGLWDVYHSMNWQESKWFFFIKIAGVRKRYKADVFGVWPYIRVSVRRTHAYSKRIATILIKSNVSLSLISLSLNIINNIYEIYKCVRVSIKFFFLQEHLNSRRRYVTWNE